jgi:hypothetical protein
MAVSAYNSNFNTNVKRKGAALVAGWPDDADKFGHYRYWTGQVDFESVGVFLAEYVTLAEGNDNWHGDVTDAIPVVACVL